MSLTDKEFALVRATAATVIELLERDNLYNLTRQHLKDLVLAAEVDRLDPAEPRPKLSAAATEAIALGMRSIVAEISESMYAAAWYSDIEYLVWMSLVRVPAPLHLQPADARALLELSRLIDGWIDDERYIPMHEWMRLYEAFQLARR